MDRRYNDADCPFQLVLQGHGRGRHDPGDLRDLRLAQAGRARKLLRHRDRLQPVYAEGLIEPRYPPGTPAAGNTLRPVPPTLDMDVSAAPAASPLRRAASLERNLRFGVY